jgi:hypothetical protein
LIGETIDMAALRQFSLVNASRVDKIALPSAGQAEMREVQGFIIEHYARSGDRTTIGGLTG